MRAKDAPAGPVNLGNPAEITMRELAQLVIGMTGSASTVAMRPLPIDDPRQRCPDITLASAHLGWRPEIPLKEGLSTTIAYFRNEMWLDPIAEKQLA